MLELWAKKEAPCLWFFFFFFFFILRRMGKNKALAHHTSAYFHTLVFQGLEFVLSSDLRAHFLNSIFFRGFSCIGVAF